MPIIGKASPEDTGLHPIHYKWAYDLYQQGIRNTWFPHEIALKEDLIDFENMTDDEQHAVKYIMSFFNPAELVVNRSIALGLYRYIKAPEAHLFLARWMFEEANHCVAFEYVLESFPLDREDVYSQHVNVKEMKAKEEYVAKYTKKMTDETLDIETIEGKKDFIRNLVATNLVMEGIWFYSGFMVILSFRQRNILRNFGSLVDWVLRDESLHLKFGMQLIHTVLEETPELLSEEFANEIQDLIVEGVRIETEYNKALFPNGILGLNAEYVNEYVKYVADRRLQEIGLAKYYNAQNPAKWMSTATDVLELVNFFEMQNTKYEADSHSGGNK